MTEEGSSKVNDNVMRKYVAELLGTFALVFFGAGSAVLAGKYIGFLGIAFAFGIVVLVMVYAIGPISGCHINPAITLSMLVARKISSRNAISYIIVQIIGAVLGAGVLLLIASGMPGYSITENGLGQNGYDAASPAGFSLIAGFLAEVVLTFFFLLVIFGATSDEAPKGFAGIAIGFTLFIIHLVGIPITGTSVNPARSIGPAIFVGGTAIGQMWMFLVAPIIGAILAAIVWMVLLAPKRLSDS
ncbi:Aquaporin Z 2 [Methanosarcinales archaeon]|nr:Aquaporin Z 2 [Methanosarcinales archaeon]